MTDVPCDYVERRTKIDIVFEKVVEHVDAEIKQCPTCDATVKGLFPADLHGPLQYGDDLKAFVVNLLVCQMVALNRVQKLLTSMMEVVVAEATLLKFVLRVNQALETWETQAAEQILQAPVIPVDETSLRVDQLNHWIHVYSAGDLTLKFLHRKRGKAAIGSINLIPRYGGVIIHDCWSSYFAYPHCGHGLCGSHLLRELTFIVDAQGYRWAKSDAHNLWERFKTQEAAIRLFAKESRMSHSPITVLSRIYGWPRSNKRSPVASGQKNMPTPNAEYPAIFKPWLTGDIIRSLLFKSPWPEMPLR